MLMKSQVPVNSSLEKKLKNYNQYWFTHRNDYKKLRQIDQKKIDPKVLIRFNNDKKLDGVMRKIKCLSSK